MNATTAVSIFPGRLSRTVDAAAIPSLEGGFCEEDDQGLATLICRYGGAASNILLDPSCHHFHVPGLTGLIGFKQYGRTVVALGDPLCAPQDRETLLDAFAASCKNQGLDRVYAVAGPWLASAVLARGGGSIEFGLDQVLDTDPATLKNGYQRDLRKKLKRARHAGMAFTEYCPQREPDAQLERQLVELARQWLASRKGPQVYWSGIDLFQGRDIRRWFYGTVDGQIVAVVATLQLESLDGHLLEHILCLPQAPVGASELMVTRTMETLAEGGCRRVTFGPAPAPELGQIRALSRVTAGFARQTYRLSNHLFHLDAKVLYRQKFRPSASQARFLLFEPARISPASLYALLRSFNLSLPRRREAR